MIRKCMMTAAVLLLMMASATGCGNKQAAEDSSAVGQSTDFKVVGTLQQGQDGDAHEKDGTKSEDTKSEDTKGDETKNEETENNETGSAERGNNEAGNDASGGNKAEGQELIIIGGKVRSVSQDSFVLSRTLQEGSVVTMPEAGSPEEELVTVRCMNSIGFERWTICGGGADIIKEAAVFSDIQEGTGLEVKGYFDGEEFAAEKVIIEVYE